MTQLTPAEIELGRARIRTWPREEREALTRMTEAEARLIVLAAAELDIVPGAPTAPPEDILEIDLR